MKSIVGGAVIVQDNAKHCLKVPLCGTFPLTRNAVAFLTSCSVFEGKEYFAACERRLVGFAPSTPTKGCEAPFGNPLFAFFICLTNYNLLFKSCSRHLSNASFCSLVRLGIPLIRPPLLRIFLFIARNSNRPEILSEVYCLPS